jgi:BlaI family penicillinase repressor
MMTTVVVGEHAMSRRADLPPLSEVQWEIMESVWSLEEATVPAIWRALSARREISRNTVGTHVQRLEEKGWLRRRSEKGAIVFTPARPREQSRGSVVQRLLSTVFAGSTEGLLVALLDEQKLSKAEADRIRAMIDQAEKRR